MPKKRVWILLAVIASLSLASLSACSAQAPESHLKMASMDQMPAEVRSAAVTVQQAYQFASANPELMQNIPCYCGCGDIGHSSNYSCYVSTVDANGGVSYDSHALGCSLCVDITQDAMRLSGQGKSPGEIRAYIDGHYSKFGPSNMP